MIDGSKVALSELRGKVVLLNFWATWCPPCREELSHVQQQVIDRFAGEEFVFLPISRGEERAAVEAFRAKTGYAFPMGLDTDETIYKRYATRFKLRNFLIDRTGRVVSATVGYDDEEFAELRVRPPRRFSRNNSTNDKDMADTKTIMTDVEGRMQRAIDHLEEELNNVRRWQGVARTF